MHVAPAIVISVVAHDNLKSQDKSLFLVVVVSFFIGIHPPLPFFLLTPSSSVVFLQQPALVEQLQTSSPAVARASNLQICY